MWGWFQGRQFCGWHGRTDTKGLALVAGFVEWADPCVEIFEVYRVAVVRGAMSMTLYVAVLFLT
jgi:hypothetical protein